MPQDVVTTEQMRSGFIIEGERETHLHRVAFRALTEAALSPAESQQMILDLAERLWTGRSRTASLRNLASARQRAALPA